MGSWTRRVLRGGRIDSLADEFAVFDLPAEFHGDRGVGFGFQREPSKRSPRLRVGPLAWQGVDQVDGLSRGDGFLQVGLRGGVESRRKGEEIDIIIV